jgi:hypothetical protein
MSQLKEAYTSRLTRMTLKKYSMHSPNIVKP